MKKKKGRLRLVFDCRQVNRSCRKARRSHLATPSALCALRVDPLCGSSPFGGRLVTFDLVDSFYLLKWDALSELLCVDDVFLAGELDITEVLDENNQWVAADPSDAVFVGLCIIPMGWSWSLFFFLPLHLLPALAHHP